MDPEHKLSNCTAKQTLYLVSYARVLDVIRKSFKAHLSSAPVALIFVLCMFVLEDISNPCRVVIQKIPDHLPSSITVQRHFQVQ